MTRYKKSRYNIIFTHDGQQYLYNTFTGSFQPFPDNLRRIYEGWEDENAVSRLADMGALVAADFDELAFLQEIKYCDSSIDRITELGLWVLTTEKCNCSCFYCFEDRSRCSDISYPADDFLSFLAKFPALNKLNITWFGGEPLLNISSLEELSQKMLAYCQDRGLFYHAGIITNAVLLTPEMVKRLKAMHVSRAQITLDGPPQVHERYKGNDGIFAAVLDNLYYAADEMDLSVRINLDNNNVQAMPELFELMAKRGFKNVRIYFAPITQSVPRGEALSPWTESCMTSDEFAASEQFHYELLYNLGYPYWQLPENGARITFCGGATNSFYTIGVNGDLYPCSHMAGEQASAVGNIRDGILPEKFTHAWLKEHQTLPRDCCQCSYLPHCQGGCPYSREHSSSQGENCWSSRYNLTDRLARLLTQAKLHKKSIFVNRSAEQQAALLVKLSQGITVNKHDLKAAAIQGGGLGMLVAGMGYSRK